MTRASQSTMRAWQSTAPGIAGLTLTTLPVPKPRSDEALVRVETGALNFSDLLMIDGQYQVRPDRPFICGQEIAGTVVEAGPQSRLTVGDRIASKVDWGGFGEYASVRGDMAIRIPDTVSAMAASALPVVYTTAMVALTESTTVRPGETVLVLAAAGGVGLAAVEIARQSGAQVIAAAGGDDKCQLALQHGAHHAVDYRKDKWSAAVKSLIGDNGVDVIVDPVGGPAALEALRLIAWNGRLLIVGFTSGTITQIPANRLLLRRASAIGVYWNHDRDVEMLAAVTRRLGDMLQAGQIKPHVGAEFSFEDLPQALAALSERKTTGKVVITLGSGEKV